MCMRMKAFLYQLVKKMYNNIGVGKYGKETHKEIMIRNGIKRAAAVGLVLVLAGCGAPPAAENIGEEEAGITSMEKEPDLAYEVPESSPNILVNQLGYITGGTKVAFFCGEELPTEFYVINADTKERVLTGYTEDGKYQEEKEKYFGYGDFSALTKPGKYYLEAPLLGRSYSFQIEDDLYTNVFREACRQYYYNRCGTSLTNEFAGDRAHNACHTGNAVLREDISISMDVMGGWHQDAQGSKDVAMASKSIGVMLLAYELHGDAFGDDMGIPESGNGIPDILDEVRYEIDWLLKMQDPATGAVYEGVTIYEQGGGKGPVSYVEPAKIESAKAFAAALAKFGYLYQNYENDYARDCLKASDRAWKYVELNGRQETEEADPWKLTAAAELYRASGLYSCHRYIKDYFRQNALPGEGELDEVSFWGYVTYISTKQQVSLNICGEITKEIMQKTEEIAEKSRSSPYFVEEGEGYEHNQKLLQNMMYLTMVDYMIANHEYDGVIENHLHYFMGRNPQAVCYIDDVGEKNYKQIDETLGIMKQFDADSRLIFMLSKIVRNCED